MQAIARATSGEPAAPDGIPEQAHSDAQAVELWLHGRPASTQRAYRREIGAFLRAVPRPLAAVTLADVQRFADLRARWTPATQARSIKAIRSLYSFLLRIGYVRWNVAAPVRAPAIKGTLAERILPEPAVYALLHEAKGWDARNFTMLLVAYAGGLRVSELVSLKWRDAQPRQDGGQLTVVLPLPVWRKLLELGPGAPDAPVFPSRAGGGVLSTVQAWRIVRKAAQLAGILAEPGEAPEKGKHRVSPHVLRHCHASHALDRGAPISLVQATLGHGSVQTTGLYLHARPGESSGRYLGLSDL
jgi:integrase/recombinase XerD